MIKKYKFRLFIAVFITSILVFSLVIQKNKSSVFATNNKDIKTVAESNAKGFLNDIVSVEKNGKYKDSFDKITVNKHPKLKLNRWMLENDEVSIECDEKGNPITFMDKKKTSQEKINNSNKKIDNDKLKEKAIEFSDKFSKDDKTFDSVVDLSNEFRAFKWKRTYNGIKYDYDFIMVTLDPSTSEVAGASKRFISLEPNNKIKLSNEQAIELAKSAFSKNEMFEIGAIKNVEKLVVNPNYRWTDKETPVFNPQTRIAYAVNFQMIKPYDGDLVVWIDAENGGILGGVISK